jgi:hypothetical protein
MFTAKKIWSAIVITVTLFAFFHCSKPLDIEIPAHKPRLVLHGYTAIGDTFRIVLSRTLAVNETNTEVYGPTVQNGWVVLYDGTVTDTLTYNAQKKLYVSKKIVAKADRLYKIKATAISFDTVEAHTTSPKPVHTLPVIKRRSTLRTSDGKPLDDIILKFQDPAEKNYYLTQLFGAFGSWGFCMYTYDPAVEKYVEQLVPFEAGNCISSRSVIFNDQSFNGQAKELLLHTGVNELKVFHDPATGETWKPYVKQHVISEDYYNYHKDVSYLDAAASSPTFSEHYRVRSNVKNGYGLFTVFAVTIDSIP